MRAPVKDQDGRRESYHHGSLREALLEAAERILTEQGIQGLTLRAAAREAGVSHAAPKNHFGDLQGLLSELAAIGFRRLAAAMSTAADGQTEPTARKYAIGRAYIDFARASPALFLLMFRGERLDFTRPALNEAAAASFGILTGIVAGLAGSGSGAAAVPTTISIAQAAGIAASWGQVHGIAMLLIDGRLAPLMAKLPGVSDAELLDTIFMLGQAQAERAR